MARKNRLPLGISDYRTIIEKGYVYVDKTQFIEKLEDAGSYINFLRPRRFGKSLFTSMLKYYYDANYADEFEGLFGSTYIGSHKTEEQGAYYVMPFDFSGLNTDGDEAALRLSFLIKTRETLYKFSVEHNIDLMPDFDNDAMPADVMAAYLNRVSALIDRPVYIIIDEYDHFANEILGFKTEMFSNVVSKTGFVRKWYEAVKRETGTGVVGRLFMTGVSPITLDSVTSGFNITSSLTTLTPFNDMMGFTEEELRSLMKLALPSEVYETKEREIFATMQMYYDGYLFNEDAMNRIFNSNMSLYYLNAYQMNGAPPKQLLDVNVASDYAKLASLFALKNKRANHEVLRDILDGVPQSTVLTPQFSLEKRFDSYDFLSLLYYLGFLTIESQRGGKVFLRVPNYVIKGLYFDFFWEVLGRELDLRIDTSRIDGGLERIGFDGDNGLFIENIEEVLRAMADKDYLHFNENHVKLIALTQCMKSPAYLVKTEVEVEGGRIDFALLPRQGVHMDYYAIIELKYLKKGEYAKGGAALLEEKRQEAKKQLLAYGSSRELTALPQLKKWVLIFAGDKCVLNEEV